VWRWAKKSGRSFPVDLGGSPKSLVGGHRA
jgi:hypothetical protein